MASKPLPSKTYLGGNVYVEYVAPDPRLTRDLNIGTLVLTDAEDAASGITLDGAQLGEFEVFVARLRGALK